MMRALGARHLRRHALAAAPRRPGEGDGGGARVRPALSRAAAAVGVDGYFFEVHDDPANARSDRATQLPLAALPKFLGDLLKVDTLRRELAGC